MLYGRNSKHSHEDNMTVLGGSLYEDAKLYRMNLRQDVEIYEELYGISPFNAPKSMYIYVALDEYQANLMMHSAFENVCLA